MISIWDTNFVVVDVETTGSNPASNRIIEVACVVVKDGSIKEEFSTLINPHQHIPYFISKMTGITNEMVFKAPSFEQIAKKLKGLFSQPDSVFVAHNVNFDYNFIKFSFERSGETFPDIPKLCTLKLAKRLISGITKRNVGALSEYLGIAISNRHRAFGDARATAQILLELLEITEDEHNISTTEELLKFQYKNLTSINIAQKISNGPKIDLSLIPDTPGVYYFIDKYDKILYIGKAKSLKRRIQSYLNITTSKKVLRLLRATKKIKWKTTSTELRALIEESKEIKQHKPEFNVLSKKFKNFPFIQISRNKKYPVFEIIYEPNPADGDTFGPFKNFETAELILEIIYKKFKLKKCEKDIDRKNPETSCLYFQTKQCIAPCLSNFNDADYLIEIEKVKNFLTNLNDGLVNFLENKMYYHANNYNFEVAQQIKTIIYEVRKIFENPKNGKAQINMKNFIIINPVNSGRNHEILFIKNGVVAWDTYVNGVISVDKIKKKLFEVYFQNTLIEGEEIQPEKADEIRIVLNWMSQHRNEITVIEVNNDLNTICSNIYNNFIVPNR